jgi:hypothetical protein
MEEYKKCNANDGFCKTLNERMDMLGHRGKGIQPLMVMTKSYTSMETRGAMYKTNAKDRGLMLNFCPFCGESLRWWENKESTDAPANIQQQVQADPTDSLTQCWMDG